MKIKKKKAIDWKSIEGVVIPVFKNRSIGEVVKQYPEVESFLKKYKFKGNINESIVVNSTELSKLLVVVGAGHVKQRGDAAKCANNIISIVKNYLLKNICVHFVQDTDIPDTYSTNFIDFLHINHYRFDAYLEKKEKDKKIKNISLVFECQKQISSEVIKEREIISNSLIMVRDLVNEIPEKLNPDTLVDAFVKVSKELDLDISVMRQKQLEEQKLKGIILVGRASPYEPALIRIGYTPDNYKKTLIVVGKGITFDSGGLNIKVGNYMQEMKCDMAGAATVLGIIKSAAELKLPVRIIAYAGIAENMPGRQAYKPGDIITYKNNKTVEVVNTDAEGRLVLADALIQAAKEKPDYIVEFSTLTGAILVALGDMIAGVMCDNQRFTRLLERSSEKTCDFLWEMPLFEEYKESIKSKVAHIKNADYKGASSIKAGLFLKEFTDNIHFAHIDIAGTAFLSKTNAFYSQQGATGFGIRLIIEFMNWLR